MKFSIFLLPVFLIACAEVSKDGNLKRSAHSGTQNPSNQDIKSEDQKAKHEKKTDDAGNVTSASSDENIEQKTIEIADLSCSLISKEITNNETSGLQYDEELTPCRDELDITCDAYREYLDGSSAQYFCKDSTTKIHFKVACNPGIRIAGIKKKRSNATPSNYETLERLMSLEQSVLLDGPSGEIGCLDGNDKQICDIKISPIGYVPTPSENCSDTWSRTYMYAITEIHVVDPKIDPETDVRTIDQSSLIPIKIEEAQISMEAK